jgi:hypothetical protein
MLPCPGGGTLLSVGHLQTISPPFLSNLQHATMKRFLLLASVFLCLSAGFSACQCSDKPEIGPVEQAAAAVAAPHTA